MISSKPFSLLMVDDDDDDCMLVKDAIGQVTLSLPFYSLRPLLSISLKNSGIAFRYLHDGLNLVEYLQESKKSGGANPPLPDVILLDLNMPFMNGYQVLKWIKSSPDFQTIPVVVFATCGEEATKQQCYACGANDFFQKPTKFDDLVEIIRSLERQWRFENLPP
jgi:CheY-like chemotaxis protein